MTETILLAHTQAEPLRRLLAERGYHLSEADSVEAAGRRLTPAPGLLLLDAELGAREGWKAWDRLIRNATAAGIPCLLFSSESRAAAEMEAFGPWRSGVIRNPADPVEVLVAVASQFAVSRLNRELEQSHRLLYQKEHELQRHLRSAAHIQKALVPTRFPRLPTLSFAWQFLPCHKVGGDLFNVMQLDEHSVMAFMLDVTGHGLSSAMVTVSVYQSLSLHTGRIVKQVLPEPPYYRLLSPAEVLRELDLEYPFERFESFFTIAYLLIDPKSGAVRYSSAGHPPPALVRADGTTELLSEGGTIIGLGGIVPFTEGVTQLRPGDRIYLYTDGITERSNDSGEMYGQQRLLDLLAERRHEPLEAICRRVVDAVHAFDGDGPLEDDLTLLGLEFKGGDGPAREDEAESGPTE